MSALNGVTASFVTNICRTEQYAYQVEFAHFCMKNEDLVDKEFVKTRAKKPINDLISQSQHSRVDHQICCLYSKVSTRTPMHVICSHEGQFSNFQPIGKRQGHFGFEHGQKQQSRVHSRSEGPPPSPLPASKNRKRSTVRLKTSILLRPTYGA